MCIEQWHNHSGFMTWFYTFNYRWNGKGDKDKWMILQAAFVIFMIRKSIKYTRIVTRKSILRRKRERKDKLRQRMLNESARKGINFESGQNSMTFDDKKELITAHWTVQPFHQKKVIFSALCFEKMFSSRLIECPVLRHSLPIHRNLWDFFALIFMAQTKIHYSIQIR